MSPFHVPRLPDTLFEVLGGCCSWACRCGARIAESAVKAEIKKALKLNPNYPLSNYPLLVFPEPNGRAPVAKLYIHLYILGSRVVRKSKRH